MSRIADFNIMMSRHRNRARNDCNVVINNNNHAPAGIPSTFPAAVSYPPSVQATKEDVVTRDADIETTSETQLYRVISLTLANILKENNLKLLANILDLSGKVIVGADGLVQNIALICNAAANEVHIEYIEEETGCCGRKINPIAKISNIKVAVTDFKLVYNREYNTLTDTYAISLKRVIVPISYRA